VIPPAESSTGGAADGKPIGCNRIDWDGGRAQRSGLERIDCGVSVAHGGRFSTAAPATLDGFPGRRTPPPSENQAAFVTSLGDVLVPRFSLGKLLYSLSRERESTRESSREGKSSRERTTFTGFPAKKPELLYLYFQCDLCAYKLLNKRIYH